jgi:hypothetical protein
MRPPSPRSGADAGASSAVRANPREQLPRGDSQRVGDLDDRVQARILVAVLQARDLGQMQPAAVGELLLRPAGSDPPPAEVSSQLRLRLHPRAWSARTGSRSIANNSTSEGQFRARDSDGPFRPSHSVRGRTRCGNRSSARSRPTSLPCVSEPSTQHEPRFRRRPHPGSSRALRALSPCGQHARPYSMPADRRAPRRREDGCARVRRSH